VTPGSGWDSERDAPRLGGAPRWQRPVETWVRPGGAIGGSEGSGAAPLGSSGADFGSAADDSFASGTPGWAAERWRPWLMGAAALAVGFVAGWLLPPTRREDEMLGDARDHLLAGVRAAGQEVVEKGREVAVQLVHDAVATVREAEDDLAQALAGHPGMHSPEPPPQFM
jgi:hypothetical protein